VERPPARLAPSGPTRACSAGARRGRPRRVRHGWAEVAGGRGGAAGGVRAPPPGPARPGRRAHRPRRVAARVRGRRRRRRLGPAAGAGRARPGGLDRQGHDGPGPAARAPGRPGRPGRPRSRPPALAAPADPLRAGQPAPPAGPHRRDRLGDGRLPVADPGGPGPRPDDAGVAARPTSPLLQRRLRRAWAGAGAGRRLLLRRGPAAPRPGPVRHDRLGAAHHGRGPGPRPDRPPRAPRRDPGPGPLGADGGRVGGDPLHRRRPRPVPAGRGRPRTRRTPTPTLPPPRRRPTRPRESFPASWRHWSGPTPPGTRGPRSCGSAPTPPAPAWPWSGPPATRSP
jgi:hypothetical protein